MKKASELIDQKLQDQKRPLREGNPFRFGDIYIELRTMNPKWNNIVDDLFDNSLNGPMIDVTGSAEETPIPWDADISVKGSNIVLTGGTGPGGSGYCECHYPKNTRAIEIYLEPDSPNDFEMLTSMLADAGIRFKTR